jgi:hypothetical protein
MVNLAIDELLEQNNVFFQREIEGLTGFQLNCLRAILAGHHSDLGERTVRDAFDLGSPSNIPRLKNALLERDLIELDGRDVFISDPVFARWLRER